jgi:hypothetical protein
VRCHGRAQLCAGGAQRRSLARAQQRQQGAADSGEDSTFKQICYMVIERNLMTDLGVPQQDQMMLLEFIDVNKDKLNTVSLRTVVKLVEMYTKTPTVWREMASVGLLKV